MAAVAVLLVHWQDADQTLQALASLAGQTELPEQVVVVENGSFLPARDLPPQPWPLDILRNEHNLGYTAALNQAFRRTTAPFVLLLNPDVQLSPNYLAEGVAFLEAHADFGAVTGKLYMSDWRRLDSTGIFWHRNWRPYDRGQMEMDRGQYDTPGEVFAACGAAALLRRAMLTDIALDGEVWDSDLQMYYDDIDIGWRGRLAGWRAGYTPTASALHHRSGAELLRRRLRSPHDFRRQGLAIANRYALWIKLADGNNLWVDWRFVLPGDVLRWLYMMAHPRLLLAVLKRLCWLWPRMRRKRRAILARRKVSAAALRHWWL